MKKKKQNVYWILFSSSFQIAAFTFGGGYVIIPLMERKFVKDLGWISSEEMLDLIAISQSSPGPLAVHIALLIGYQKAGFVGGLVAMLGLITPPFIIMTIISYVYLYFRDNVLINNILTGMSAGVAAIIINVVYNMAKQVIDRKKLIPIVMMVVALIVNFTTNISAFWILLVSALIGLAMVYRPGSTAKDEEEGQK